MYKTYWGMEFNPFGKGLSENNFFQSHDFSQAMSRLEHLKNMKGIGLFTGLSGIGKTYTLRCFTNSLNPNLYKVIYLTLYTITVLEFYKSLAYSLGVEAYSKKVDLFKAIQERIISLSKDKKITPIIIMDEAQYLKTEVLNDLKLLFNFDMDSKNYAVLITTFNCKLDTEDGTESWTGTITKIINHGSHYQLRIEARSGINVIVGTSDTGHFACIPDWGAECHLSALKDTFWNQEKLVKILGIIDGITVARALYTLSDYI